MNIGMMLLVMFFIVMRKFIIFVIQETHSVKQRSTSYLAKCKIWNNIAYTGQQYDRVTNQYYLRARYYNPVIGRFTQEDIYRGDGLNLYAYCNNNPVEYCDPSGYAKKICKDGGPKENNHGSEGGSKAERLILQSDLRKLQESGLPLYPSQGATVDLWERSLSRIRK